MCPYAKPRGYKWNKIGDDKKYELNNLNIEQWLLSFQKLLNQQQEEINQLIKQIEENKNKLARGRKQGNYIPSTISNNNNTNNNIINKSGRSNSIVTGVVNS